MSDGDIKANETPAVSGEIIPLGAILVRRGQVRQYQIDFLLLLQENYKQARRLFKLGELLLMHRIVKEHILEEALVTQKELPREGLTEIIERLQGLSNSTKFLPQEG